MSFKKIGSLEIQEEAKQFNKTFSRFVLFACIAMITISLLSIIGLTGPGLLGKTSKTDSTSNLTVNFFPFERIQNSTIVKVDYRIKEIPNYNYVRIWIPYTYLNDHIIEQINPEPFYTEVDTDKVIYFFGVNQPNINMTINFMIKPIRVGTNHSTFGIINGPTVSFTQFIFP